ncbi:heparinase II/III family protein [Longispora sp. K20-0274]|uniref:hypothetical protein n=1 Tax=Longispora sp. K20-0274 TaxID=3088255 RepID=UPI00399B68B4
MEHISAGALLTGLRQHPASPAITLAQLRRARNRPALAALVEELREDARLGEPPPPHPPWSAYRRYADDGDRETYESLYFARRGLLNARLATAALTGGDTELGALADILWDVCAEYTWALPAHESHGIAAGRPMPQTVDLFAAETAHTLAEAVALLGEALPAPVVEVVTDTVRRRVLAPLFDDPRPWPWEDFRTNWSAVCAGAAGMAALALPADDRWLAGALERCLRAMDTFLAGYEADGACTEGVDYWCYGFGYHVSFAEALRERTAVDLLTGTPLARAIAAFPASAQLAEGAYVSFSDGSANPMVPTGLVSLLARRLGTPVPAIAAVPANARNHAHRWAFLSRTLAWTDPDLLGTVVPAGTDWLPQSQWLIVRAPGGAAFAAKGGHNDEPHNHLDLGQFILAAHGEQLLADLGAGQYTGQYFGPGRYDLPHPSARWHSVPVVDGVTQRPGRDAAATATREADALLLDLSAAYGRPVRRRFDWATVDGGFELRLGDGFPGAARVEEVFVSRIRPACAGPGTVTWTGERGTATLRYPIGAWEPSVESLEVVNHHNTPETIHRLVLSGTGLDEATFEFTVTPR